MTPGQSSPYGTQTAPAGRPAGRGGSTISVQTLIVASVASAVTSYTVSRLWGPGTLVSAAATPILVALISELVRRPVVGVSSTAQKVAVAPLRFRPQTQAHDARAPSAVAPAPAPEQPRHPPRPADPDSPATGEQWGPAGTAPVVEETRGRPRWRLVLVTGLLACLIVVGLFTALDVIAGRSVTGNGAPTTYFGSPNHPKTTPKTAVPALGPTGATSQATGPTSPSATTTAPPVPAVGATGGATGSTGASGVTGATGLSTTAPQPATGTPTGP